MGLLVICPAFSMTFLFKSLARFKNWVVLLPPSYENSLFILDTSVLLHL